MRNAMKKLWIGLFALIIAVSGWTARLAEVDAASGKVSGFYNLGTVYSDMLGNGKDHSALVYWYMSDSEKISYCLQYGYLLSSGQTFESTDAALPSMSATQVKQLQYCLYYGYQAGASGICPHDRGVTCQEELIPYAATQAMVWLIVAGKYDDADAVEQWGTIVANATNYPTRILSEYRELYARMEAAMDMAPPSFSGTDRLQAPYYTMEWDKEKSAYTLTLTDTNAVLGSYDWTLPSGVTATLSGNSITFTATQEIADAAPVQYSAKTGTLANREVSSLVFWQPTDTEKQNQVQYSSVTYDPLQSFLYLKTGEKAEDPTRYRFIKTDDQGNALAGCSFQLLDGNGSVVDAWTTDSTGIHEVTDTLTEGETYTLRELDCPIGYEKAPEHTFTVTTGGDWVEITTVNPLIKASVTIYKVDAEGNPLSGAEYALMTTQVIQGADMLVHGGRTYYELKADSVKEGQLVFDGLDTTHGYAYLLVELSSPEGAGLLQKPIDLGTLPVGVEGSVDENYKGKLQIKGDVTYLYDLNYRVVNTANMLLPLTGEAGAFAEIPCLFVTAAMIAVAARHRTVKKED